jgi:hypothetical protein
MEYSGHLPLVYIFSLAEADLLINSHADLDFVPFLSYQRWLFQHHELSSRFTSSRDIFPVAITRQKKRFSNLINQIDVHQLQSILTLPFTTMVS